MAGTPIKRARRLAKAGIARAGTDFLPPIGLTGESSIGDLITAMALELDMLPRTVDNLDRRFTCFKEIRLAMADRYKESQGKALDGISSIVVNVFPPGSDPPESDECPDKP